MELLLGEEFSVFSRRSANISVLLLNSVIHPLLLPNTIILWDFHGVLPAGVSETGKGIQQSMISETVRKGRA